MYEQTALLDKKNPYLPINCTVSKIEKLTEMEKLFTIQLPKGMELKHKPGQFVELSIPGVGEAPFSISSSPTRGPEIDIGIRKVGNLTNVIHNLQTGATVGIRGPFGNGFDTHKFEGRDVLFVAGGIGLVPLRSLIQYCLDNRSDFSRLIILYGTKSPSELLFLKELDAWRNSPNVDFHLTVDRPDDHWTGNVGVITTLIPPLKLDIEKTMAVVVGPPVMYKFVLISLKAKMLKDSQIYMSLERKMKCGVGKCGHCQINGLYCCKDGPVFCYEDIKDLKEAI